MLASGILNPLTKSLEFSGILPKTSDVKAVIPFPRSRRSQRVFVPIVRPMFDHLQNRSAFFNQAAAEKFQKGELGHARALFSKAVVLNPDCPVVAFNFALLLQNENNLEEAASWYRRALTLFNDNAQAHFNLGFCLRMLGRKAESESAFRAGLKIEPRRVDILLVLGITCTERGDHEAAQRAFTRGLAVDPANATLHSYLGSTLRELGDLQGALDELRRALELDPRHEHARHNLAWVTRLLQEQAFKSLAQSPGLGTDRG